MIRAVLDTNALASGALISQGVLPTIIDLWRDGAFALVFSEEIMIELSHTLAKPYFLTRLTTKDTEDYVELLDTAGEMVAVTSPVSGVATHPEDDLILATAVDGKADYLVTGDKKLQQLKNYQGVAIVSPREFLDILKAQEEQEMDVL